MPAFDCEMSVSSVSRSQSPRVWMWTCRVIPIFCWGMWLVMLIAKPKDTAFAAQVDALDILLFLALAPYLLLVYVLLPLLIFGDKYRGFVRRLLYFAFAGLTAGLGPTVLYFVKVDPWLREMVSHQKSVPRMKKLCQPPGRQSSESGVKPSDFENGQ
jgi:hypothetical protein